MYANLDCQYTAVPSNITVTSTLNPGYGKDNINGLFDTPWVGVGYPNISFNFPNQILLTKLEMKGGDVDLYDNGTMVKCYVTRFWLHYTNETGRWYKYHPVGNRSAKLDLSCTVVSCIILNV